MNRLIVSSLAVSLLSFPTLAQQLGPTYMVPTSISAAGSYPSGGISVGAPNNTAVIELQATGSGSGLSFSVQGTPIGSTTALTLKMYTAPSCAASVTAGAANGDWFVPVAGFTNVKLVVASITGSETFGITASTQPNCANSSGAAITTTPSGTQPVSIASAPVTTTGALVTGQVAIVTTGTAVQFPANANLVNGILVSACGGYPASASAPAQHANSNGVTVGNSSVTNACTGSGTGDCIPPGASHGYGVNNTNLLWMNGVVGDCLTFAGN